MGRAHASAREALADEGFRVNSIVNKNELPRLIFVHQKQAVILFDLESPLDRATYIEWLKSLVPGDPADQINIDRCILAAGGDVEHGFPGYQVFQQ